MSRKVRRLAQYGGDASDQDWAGYIRSGRAILSSADRNSIVYAALLLEEQRFSHAVSLIEIRSSVILNEAFPRLAGAGVSVGASLAEVEAERVIGIDTTHKLRVHSSAIVTNVDEDLKSIVSAYDQLRAAMKRLYPERKFVKVEFGLPATNDA